MILYEYPLNERIRTLLRLEELFGRFAFFVGQDQPLDHHAALITMFEIADIAGRSDLKNDLVKELDRQRLTLQTYRGNPDIASDALEQFIDEVERAIANLNQIPGKPGQHLNDNEWLSSIRSRSVIPGHVPLRSAVVLRVAAQRYRAAPPGYRQVDWSADAAA